MKYYVVTFDCDWADEFSVYGVWFSTEEAHNEFVQTVKRYFEEHDSEEVYFGTNESFEFTSADDILNSISTTEISESTYLEMSSKLGDFGGISFDWLYEY